MQCSGPQTRPRLRPPCNAQAHKHDRVCGHHAMLRPSNTTALAATMRCSSPQTRPLWRPPCDAQALKHDRVGGHHVMLRPSNTTAFAATMRCSSPQTRPHLRPPCVAQAHTCKHGAEPAGHRMHPHPPGCPGSRAAPRGDGAAQQAAASGNAHHCYDRFKAPGLAACICAHVCVRVCPHMCASTCAYMSVCMFVCPRVCEHQQEHARACICLIAYAGLAQAIMRVS